MSNIQSVDASRLQGARVTNTKTGQVFTICGLRRSNRSAKHPVLPNKLYWDLLPVEPCEDSNHHLVEWDVFAELFTVDSIRPTEDDLR